MNQLDQAAQSNAASAEEIAATSGEINNLAAATQNMTIELNNVVLGGHTMTSTQTTTTRTTTKKNEVVKLAAKNNVIKMKAPAPVAVKTEAKEVIPFDEDARAKVGTTDGF
ncbi:hypothetical protein AAAA78_06655 [Bdellovibrio sp. BCCA]|uniref:hypothetical protein n=1 Tax=Bdellovibrio sp. BCCA TaxID=3136281 RepID=UPI0030F12E0B